MDELVVISFSFVFLGILCPTMAFLREKFVGTTFADYKYCEKWIKENYKFMNVSNGLDLGLKKLKSVFLVNAICLLLFFK